MALTYTCPPCCDTDCCNPYCVACPACSGAPDYDEVIAAVPVGPVALAGSRTVRPCIGAACPDQIDPDARVHFKFTNSTGVPIRINVSFDVTVTAPCQVKGIFNCDTAGAALYSAGAQAWFYVCLPVGGVFEVCMDHVLAGANSPCCGETATIDNFTYEAVEAGAGDVCYTLNPGECCGGPAAQVGFDPGCPSPTTGQPTPDPCAVDADCAGLIGTCYAPGVPCPACPLGGQFILITAATCFMGFCRIDGVFNCCTF